MSKETDSYGQAKAAYDCGIYVCEHVPFGTRIDALTPATYEIHDDWSLRGRPCLNAVTKSDKTGGFKVGMKVRLSRNATHRVWVARQERLEKHPAAGQVAVVTSVNPTSAGIGPVVEIGIGDGVWLVPGDWLSLASPAEGYYRITCTSHYTSIANGPFPTAEMAADYDETNPVDRGVNNPPPSRIGHYASLEEAGEAADTLAREYRDQA